ncbi:MAG: PIN domain-containing protein [Elusimicrobia bacterium]|nr:PIN domain-containing protein [Elusimicrobiota bacterium]
MKVYLETSVILRKLLGEPDALKQWGEWKEGCTSEITLVESLRALDRLRLRGILDDAVVAEKMRLLREILEAVDVIALDAHVLNRSAQSFPTVIGALDAVHLSSALLYVEQRDEKLVFLTHDRQLGTAAEALGLETRGLG